MSMVRLYRWPDSKPMPSTDHVYTSPMLTTLGATWGLNRVYRWRNEARHVEVVQAFSGRRVGEIEISDRTAMDGFDSIRAALRVLADALTPDALDIMHEAQVEPLPVYR